MILLDNTPSQTFKFRTKNWININDCKHRTYNTNSQIKCKITMLKSSSCDYSDTYILVKGTITITRGTATVDAAIKRLNKRNKGEIFKNYASFTGCISKQIIPK